MSSQTKRRSSPRVARESGAACRRFVAPPAGRTCERCAPQIAMSVARADESTSQSCSRLGLFSRPSFVSADFLFRRQWQFLFRLPTVSDDTRSTFQWQILVSDNNSCRVGSSVFSQVFNSFSSSRLASSLYSPLFTTMVAKVERNTKLQKLN